MAGYREHEHTADWELEVWAPDLPGLFEQAATGMYALSGMRLQAGERYQRRFQVQAYDVEGLLVRFLSELLYLEQENSLGFDRFSLRLLQAETGESLTLEATVEGAVLLSVDKEVKAVTYHNLAVRQEAGEFRVQIVFDV